MRSPFHELVTLPILSLYKVPLFVRLETIAMSLLKICDVNVTKPYCDNFVSQSHDNYQWNGYCNASDGNNDPAAFT